ncbi:DNA polymerase V [Acholeplasma morum]|uniref:Y-family DNA polymerase n=1 Tax=Paracholeplasma morum TaxID=264637 RepID=UPI001956890F|nr:damage repair protein [Paracholeplasma morum]MBM7453643.1 DNA polymerase V [Paracholeplasma morum]
MDEYKLKRKILCIDLKSFYASVECALLGLDPFKTPLVVADDSRGGGGIVLAVSPYLKSKGVPSRCRIYELPTDLGIMIQKPQMHTYLTYSTEVIKVYLEFISEQDLYVYSIDEAFLDVTEYLTYYQKNDYELAKEILKRIHDKLDLFATCGIGENMLMAKLALDIESKKSPDFIAKWTYEDIPHKLWPVAPLSEMWSIGVNMQRRLNQMGFWTIGDIANADVKRLKKQFGILGEELYYHTHGIDMSLIQDKGKMSVVSKSYGMGQTLFKDYYRKDIYQIILEMTDEISRRLRLHKKHAKVIHFGVAYSKLYGGGFHRQLGLTSHTSSPKVIFETCKSIFETHYEDLPIRHVHISVSSLMDNTIYQPNLFEDLDETYREFQLGVAMDEIKMRFGKNSINRASSELESSTIKARNKMIGGHHG